MAKRNKYNEDFGGTSFNPGQPGQTPFGGYDPFSVPDNSQMTSFNPNQNMAGPYGPNTRSTSTKKGFNLGNLLGNFHSWGIVGIIVGIIVAIVLMVVFRREITSFLMDVLTWVIVIAVLYFLIRRFIFRR